MIDTIPNGKQHNTVDRIAQISQLSGLELLFTDGWGGVGGNGGGVEGVEVAFVNHFASSGTSPAGSHWAIPFFHTRVFLVTPLLINSSGETGPFCSFFSFR